MQNLSIDYSEIISDSSKQNFIKAYFENSMTRSKSDIKKKLSLRPKDLIYEGLPPIDNDPNLIKHRSNIIKSRIAQDKSVALRLENSRDVSFYLDSRLSLSTNHIHSKLREELLVSIGAKDSNSSFALSTDLNELKKQVTQADLLIWNLNSTKEIDFTGFTNDFFQINVLKRPQSLSFGEYGGPSNRKEVEMLSNWLNFMLTQLLDEKSSTKSDLFEGAQIIYTTCLKELCRQISVHCAERGELLQKVWKTYLSIMIKTINVYQSSKITLQKRFFAEIEGIKERYIQEIVKLKDDIDTKDKKIKEQDFSMSEKDLIIKRYDIKIKKLTETIKTLQSQYSKDKIQLIRLEDEYRNLKEVQKIVLEDIDENLPGIKKVQPKSKIRFRELSKLFLADPLCGNLSEVNIPDDLADAKAFIELDKIDLENKIKMHQIQGKIEETAEELIDCGVDTHDLAVVCNNFSSTELADFPVSPVDFYVSEYPPKDLHSLEQILNEKIKLQTWSNEELENYFGKAALAEEKKLLDVNLEFDPHSDISEDLKVYKSEKQREHVRSTVKKMTTKILMKNQKKLNSIKSEIEDLADKRKYDQHELLRLRKQIFLTYKENIKMKEDLDQAKEQINKLGALNRRKILKKAVQATKKKNPTLIQEFKLNQKIVLFKKNEVSPAEELFKKGFTVQERKAKVTIRSITLVRLMNALINDYSILLKEDQILKTQPLYIFVYEYFSAKHGGVKKVLETKYRQFLLACDFHKRIPCINLFCRFLGLIEPLEIEFFRTYILILELLQKFSKMGVEILISEIDDPLIPSIRCHEVLNTYFKDKFSDPEISQIKTDMNKIVKPCPRCINQGVVERSEFVLFIIQNYQNFLKLSTNNVKDLFEAADLNGDKFLQFEEFDMLFRCIEGKKYSKSLASLFFDSYSDLIAEVNGVNYPVISYERFTIFALEKDYFSIEAQNKFIGDTDLKSICRKIQVLHNKSQQVISEIKWRISKSNRNNTGLNEMIETLKKKIVENDQKRSVYIAYLLIDQDSKYQAIDSKVESFLPSINGYYKMAKDMYTNKKEQISAIKRQATWKQSLESLSDWDEKESHG